MFSVVHSKVKLESSQMYSFRQRIRFGNFYFKNLCLFAKWSLVILKFILKICWPWRKLLPRRPLTKLEHFAKSLLSVYCGTQSIILKCLVFLTVSNAQRSYKKFFCCCCCSWCGGNMSKQDLNS